MKARHKLTGDIKDVRPEAVDRPGGFFESLPKSPRVKRESVETPVAPVEAVITEPTPETGESTTKE